jgi:hypothetical protein
MRILLLLALPLLAQAPPADTVIVLDGARVELTGVEVDIQRDVDTDLWVIRVSPRK